MRRRTAARLASGLALLSGLLFALGVGFYLAGSGITSDRVFSLIAVIVFSGVGNLIVWRHPSNPIGWIFCGTAVASGLGTLSYAYALYWLDGHGGSEALGQAAAAYENASWIPGVLVPVTFLLLLFPDVRLLSARWRPVAWCAVLGIVLSFFMVIVTPGPLEDFPSLENPYGVGGWAREPLETLAALMVLVALVGSPLSLVLRLRRAGPEQRQQIKWLVWAGALAAAIVLIGSTAGYAYAGEAVTNAAVLSSILALPVAAGMAMLRYRLYDVDVVINRTLVYGALTATLGACYLGLVLLLQLALSPLTESSNLAIAGSTLAVAALVRPGRARIQALVDRRFYRSRYDATRTLEGFGARLRDQVELDSLSAELRGVVADTMQPAHVSLWLREGVRR
jgi:hypothetical protein